MSRNVPTDVTSNLANKRYECDGVIIGAGHNALVLAGYLTKCGYDIALVEHRPEIGGGAGTFESDVHPTVYHERHSLFHRDIPNLPWYDDLDLAEFGLEYFYPQVNNGMPLKDGRNLIIHANPEETKKSIARLNEADAERYGEMYDRYGEMAEKIWFAKDYSPPMDQNEFDSRLGESELGREYLEINERSARDVIMDKFENPHLQAFYLFLFSVRGYHAGGELEGTGFAVPAMTYLGTRAMLAKGGSRSLGRSLGWAVTANGGRIFAAEEVDNIIVEDDAARGVTTTSGKTFTADFVVSSVDPHQTFLRFIGEDNLPSSLIDDVQDYRYGITEDTFGVLFAAHATTEAPPEYASADWDDRINRAFNTCVGYETPDDVIDHLGAVLDGDLPEEIGVQCACPTVHDPTRAPDGKHVLLAWQFAPYDLFNEGPDAWEDVKGEFLEKVFVEWGEYAPNIDPHADDSDVIDMFPQTPPDTERSIQNFREGCIFGGAFLPSQLGENRPLPQVSNYRVPWVDDMYLTGASTHPGGNITGAPGYNAAKVIAEDRGTEVWWNPPNPREILESLD